MSDPQGYDPFVNDPHGAVGAYVADALDDDERTVFELHLAGCESCLREVAEFTETAAELAWLTEATPPPSDCPMTVHRLMPLTTSRSRRAEAIAPIALTRDMWTSSAWRRRRTR